MIKNFILKFGLLVGWTLSKRDESASKELSTVRWAEHNLMLSVRLPATFIWFPNLRSRRTIVVNLSVCFCCATRSSPSSLPPSPIAKTCQQRDESFAPYRQDIASSIVAGHSTVVPRTETIVLSLARPASAVYVRLPFCYTHTIVAMLNPSSGSRAYADWYGTTIVVGGGCTAATATICYAFEEGGRNACFGCGVPCRCCNTGWQTQCQGFLRIRPLISWMSLSSSSSKEP